MGSRFDRTKSTPRPGVRAGAMLPYAVLTMVALLAVASFAVDWGYVQLTKTEMQRQADATARGYLALYDTYGTGVADAVGTNLHSPSAGWNPVDGDGGTGATVNVTWGYWANGAFHAGTNSSYPLAVRCVVSRRRADGNPLQMSAARSIGWATADVTCTATAVLIRATTEISNTLPGTSDLWLAGMPPGTRASANNQGQLWDTADTAAPYQSSIPLVPGTALTFTYVAGQVGHGPTQTPLSPDGNPSAMQAHTAGAENGIANARMPLNAMLGMFLDDTVPTDTPTPAMRDYSTPASRNLDRYDDLQLKQPFFIGDGLTSGGISQRFVVPAGATRLFLGTMDGSQWHNNIGQLEVKVKAEMVIELVK